MLVDKDGNYLTGGHTTVGMGVVNWDYLALKVNSQTKEVMFRKTFGQPRNFKAKFNLLSCNTTERQVQSSPLNFDIFGQRPSLFV